TIPSAFGSSSVVQGSDHVTATLNSHTSSSFAFTYDKTAPNAPSITSVGGGDSTVSSQSGDSNVVGTAENNATVSVYKSDGTTLLGTTTANGSGAWTYSLTAANITSLGQGTGLTVKASATDAAGNTSASLGTSSSFAVDTVANAPVISSVGGG